MQSFLKARCPPYYLILKILKPNCDLYLLKFKMHIPFQPTIPFLGIYLEIYLHTCMSRKVNMQEYSLQICLEYRKIENKPMSFNKWWLYKPWYIHKLEYHKATNKNRKLYLYPNGMIFKIHFNLQRKMQNRLVECAPIIVKTNEDKHT